MCSTERTYSEYLLYIYCALFALTGCTSSDNTCLDLGNKVKQIQEGRNNGTSDAVMGARIFSTYSSSLGDPRFYFLLGFEKNIYKNPPADPESVRAEAVKLCDEKLMPQLKKLEEMGKPLN